MSGPSSSRGKMPRSQIQFAGPPLPSDRERSAWQEAAIVSATPEKIMAQPAEEYRGNRNGATKHKHQITMGARKT